jgi:hypothetical protein
MSNVTTYYGLPKDVEFLDVDVAIDNRLYLDPYVVRLEKGPSPYGRSARALLADFFEEIFKCVISPAAGAQAKGLDLLQHFNEPKETRLGMSKGGIDGHGGDEEVGELIWESLSTDLRALIEVGVLKRVEHIPLFVEGVDKDITSDLTTRIIFEPLCKFTRAMMQKYPQFTAAPHQTEIFHRPFWDATQHQWAEKGFLLPIAEEDPLVLIPKRWVRPLLVLRSTRYYDTSLLSFVQEKVGTRDPKTGKLHAPPKWSLKRRKGLGPGAETVRLVTEEASSSFDRDLVDQFEAFARSRYDRLDDDELADRLT